MPENPNADPYVGSEDIYGTSITMATANSHAAVNNSSNNNRKSSAHRVSSAGTGYYDIATQLLGKQGSDLEDLFIAAARDGLYEKIETFLQRNRNDYVISIDVKDRKTGNTPLIWAAKRGHAKIVQLLLRHGADLTLRNYEGHTAVEVASPSIRSILLESVERSTEASHQLLLQAAWQGDIRVVARLLAQKKVLDINCQNAEGFTPIMLATRDMLLFERFSTQMSRPYDPVEVVSDLMTARADIHASDSDGKTCLHHAAQSKANIAHSVVSTIISGGGNLEQKDKRCFAPIHCASLTGNSVCISNLLDGGSEVNSRGFAGATPLHITSYNNHEKATSILLEYGANVTLTDDRGLTPMDFAKTRKMKKRLQEAWVETSNNKASTSLRPIRSHSREDLRASIEDLSKRKKGEVIFEGLPSNPFSEASKKDAGSTLGGSVAYEELFIIGGKGLTRHSSLKEKSRGEDETSTPVTAFNNNVRRLGQVRNQKPAPLPRTTSRSTERLPSISPDRSTSDRNLESPVMFGRNSRNRRSFEDRNGRGRQVPMSTRDRISAIADEVFSPGRQSPTPSMQQHRRAESDPSRSTPNLLDLAASCDNFLQPAGRRGRSYSVNSPANDLTLDSRSQNALQRESTVSSLQRDITLMSVQRESTLMSVCSTRTDSRLSNNASSPRHLNLGQMLCKSKTPVQNVPLYGPGSSKVIPPTPTFITQRNPSSLETRNESDVSPRSEDDERPEFLRTKTIFKEEFMIEESRPKDPFIHCSSGSGGSDTVSSSGSSHHTPSPREMIPFVLGVKPGASSNKQVTRQLVSQGSTGTYSSSAKSAKYLAERASAKVRNAKVSDKASDRDAKKTSDKCDIVGVKVKVKQEPKSNTKLVVTNEIGRETSFVEAIAQQRAADANSASKHASTKPKSKQGGNIVVHTDTEKAKSENKNTASAGAKSDSANVANDATTAVPLNESSKVQNEEVKRENKPTTPARMGNTNASSAKSNAAVGVRTPTQNRKTLSQKQKLQNVLQVVPTKLTENIIRTAPKVNKDTADAMTATKTAAANNENVSEPVQAKNVNMQLSPTAQVATRCANQGNTDAAQKKGVQNAIAKTTADATTVNQSENKPVNQTGTPKGMRTVSSSAITSTRLGVQSRNSNINVTRSANVPQRQNPNVKTPGSTYTPRFKTAAKSESSQVTSANNADKKTEDSGLTLKIQHTSEEKNSIQNSVKPLKSGSPTELVPSSVCKNSSMAKSYNMASNSSKSKSANNVSSTAITSTTSSSAAVVSTSSASKSSSNTSAPKRNELLSKSTSDAVSGSAKLSSASIISKSISQMPGVGSVAADNANKHAFTRSASLSGIEEKNEQKRMSSSDTKIIVKTGIIPKRPLSDGNNPKDVHNAPLLPVDNTAPRVSNRNQQNMNTLVSTPLIVNPFEELEQKRAAENIQRSVTATEFGFVIERPSNERSKTQASLKSKNAQKVTKKTVVSKDAKATVSATRSTSAKRKRPKVKESNKSDGESGRPKSGKSTKGRARSGKRRKKPLQDTNLAKENEKPDVALIGGIGWHLQTSCLDKSDADAVVVSAITSSESESEDEDVVRLASPLSVKIQTSNLQIPNAIVSNSPMNSPRFREIRPSFADQNEVLPYMENDGFPPMNLDMTQQNRSGVFIADIPDDISEFLAKLKEEDNNAYDALSDSSGEDESERSEKVDMISGLYHNEAMVGKLTPIPESPANTHSSSALQRVAKTVDAIKRFDNQVQEDDLNKLLGATPREKSGNSYASVSMEKGNVISIRTNLARASGGSVRSLQSKDSNAAVMGSAGSRGVSSRNSSSRTNTSRAASLSGGNAVERSSGKGGQQQSSPQPRGSGGNVNDQHTRNNLSKGGKSVVSKATSDTNRSINVSQKSNPKSADRKDIGEGRSRSGNENILDKEAKKIDLKELLAEKMKTTEKMLQENVTEKNKAKKSSDGGDVVFNEEKSDHNAKGNKDITVPNLDIGALDSGRTDDEVKSTRSSTRRERKYSETKVTLDREEDIDEAIDEIMTNTFPSRRSSRSQNASLRSASSTLTEADSKLLKQMIQNNTDSPFHARENNVRASSSYDDSVTLNRDNPELMKRFHANDLKLGQKVKAMIDAGADSLKVKAMIKSDTESKQLARIMNSFRQMELYAGPVSHQNRSSKKETPRPPGEENVSHPAGTSHRPGSAGGGRMRTGKFTEIKGGSSSASHAGHDRPSSPSAVPKDLAEEFRKSRFVRISSQQDMEEEEAGVLPDDEMLSFERPDSACTTASSNSSVFEETIQWKKGNVLGKGAFGTVWCGLTSEGQLIAVKQIELNTNNHTKAKKEYEKVQEEVELLKTLEHRNIVGYLGTSLEDSIVSIFMQFVPGGSIASILARFGALDESVFRKYTRQILEGVEYLHDNDVIHRDIKGGNVMLMPNGVIKLIDFGCAKRLCINLSMGQSEILKSMKGTPYWMAPEVVNETGHGKKSDIWSVGCTVFEMATRKPPWSDMNPMAAIFAIGSDKPVPQLPEKFSDDAHDFVNQCLSKDQGRRPSASELLQSVFIRRRPKKSVTSNSSYC